MAINLVIHPAYLANADTFKTLISEPQSYLKQGGSCTVWANDTWVIKRYNQKNNWVLLKQNLGFGRAKKVYQQTQMLIAAGIATPQTVAYGYQKKFGFKRCEYIVSQRQSGRLLFDILMDETITESDKQTAIDLALTAIEQLWQAGWTHGDLKAQNIIIDDKAYLIDLDALCQSSDTRKDKARFLRNFQDNPELTPFYDHVAKKLELAQ